MTTDLDPTLATRLVVGGGLLLGLALGALAQASRFCVRGGISDYVIFRGPGRLFAWLLAVAVAMAGVQALAALGVFDASRTLSWGERLTWLSSLAGGLLFGAGMMLAPGCPQRCLVKAGAGDMKAAATLLVVAVAAVMTLRGVLALPRANGLDTVAVALGRPQDWGHVLASWLPASDGLLRALLAAAVAAAVAALGWHWRRRLERGTWIAGLGMGLLVPAAFWLTGHVGFIAEDPQTLEPAWLGTASRRPEGLSFVSPLAGTLDLLTLWTDKSMVASFGVLLALGVLLGSHASARLRGEFRLESFRTPRDLGQAALGGVLMGFGGVTALGCSVGNGVTGLALQSGGSLLAVAGMVTGALLVLRRHAQRAEQQSAGDLRAPARPDTCA